MKGRKRRKDSRLDPDSVYQTLNLEIWLSKKFDKFMKDKDIGNNSAMMILGSWIIQNNFELKPKEKVKRRSYIYDLSREMERIISKRASEAGMSKNQFLTKALEEMLK